MGLELPEDTFVDMHDFEDDSDTAGKVLTNNFVLLSL